MGSISGLGRSPGEGNGNSLQYSCLGNPTEEPGKLQTMMLQRVRHNLVTECAHACTHTHTHRAPSANGLTGKFYQDILSVLQIVPIC